MTYTAWVGIPITMTTIVLSSSLPYCMTYTAWMGTLITMTTIVLSSSLPYCMTYTAWVGIPITMTTIVLSSSLPYCMTYTAWVGTPIPTLYHSPPQLYVVHSLAGDRFQTHIHKLDNLWSNHKLGSITQSKWDNIFIWVLQGTHQTLYMVYWCH